MTEEVKKDEEVVIDPLVDDLSTDEDFEAGFTGQVTEPKEAAAAETETPAAEVVPEVKYRQVTEAEWADIQARSTEIDKIKADHRKEWDKAFGKLGGVERTLAALQAATPAGYTVEGTDDIVDGLRKDGFTELADLTLKSFKAFAGKLKGTAPAPAAALDPKVIEATVTQRLVDLQLEALEDEHADWRDVVGAKDSDNDYRKWLASQPADYKQRLESTNSAAIISRSISKFQTEHAAKVAADKEAADKAALEAANSPAAKKKAAEEAAAKAAAARKQRIEAAVTPKGSGGHATQETEDPFEEGFKSGPAGQTLK